MNLRQLLDAGPAKAAGILQALSDTSNGAVKSRQKLFDALKAELEGYGNLLERHLLPALKQHEKTRDLVPDTAKAIREFRGKLAELDALAKDDEAFLPSLKELTKTFQEMVRSEQKDLVPSVLRAASEEQAAREQAAREQAEMEKARAQKEREQAALQKAADETARKAAALKAAERSAVKAAEKEAAEQSRQAAERKAVRAARKAAGQKAAVEVRQAAEHKAAERAMKAAARKAAAQAARQASENQAALAARKAAARKAAKAQQRAVEQTVAGPRSGDTGPVQALAAFSMAATRGMTEVGSAWMEWLGSSGGAHAQQSLQLLRCRTLQDLAHTQQSFLAGSAQGWMEHNRRVLEISRAAAEESMRAFGGSRPGPTAQQ